ncbi:MAG: ribonuclease Y [Sphaerochaetaceae bacterium]|nr:ribonuclease Y [Sphaerochaetaceae bacterium]NLO59741.1 ribonuclease Y [Spirochaetales bacterium]MDD2405210.1 ribonuclease Y [Sphaerochaetaceae bacterium]MDD3671671.1 ribonuclease Y [Sphaerochaetaceae bacterium]MDD4258818.1 ribonuclease Y [Sphaerochaetaceae bacterium]
MGKWWIIPLCLACVFLGWFIRWIYARFKLTSIEQKAVRLSQEAIKEAEAKSKELLLETRDQLFKEQQQQEREARERRSELQRTERRLLLKEENLERKQSELDVQKRQLADREAKSLQREKLLSDMEENWRIELERIAGMTSDEAKQTIVESMQNEAKRDAQLLINKIEQDAQMRADKLARDIIVSSIQRLATEVSSEVTVTTVSLPSDEMKGRIIGREGRNIRTLETLTGVDVIIDDTPEAVVISCFDPVRKEIARVALERLVQDGRIHPARIEEVVAKVTKEITRVITEEGEKALFDLGIHNMSQEMVRALGKLHFRTSYGQNVLSHSKEVAVLAGMIASEVGADREIARRGGLLHDIGKGIETDGDANHAEMGADLAKRLGEDPRVINSILSHHDDIEPNCVESVIVQIADAISAARPGARRETLDNYIKRLESLEEIAESFTGVDKAYAIQAGRELRILVNNDSVTDDGAKEIAKGIAGRIEAELRYPGRIKVTIIREMRVVEYAR